jgi:hypothetical protein
LTIKRVCSLGAVFLAYLLLNLLCGFGLGAFSLEFLLGNEISGAYSKKKSLQIKSIILNLNYKKQIF